MEIFIHNKELFEKVCNLTCTFEDVNIDASNLEYDKKSLYSQTNQLFFCSQECKDQKILKNCYAKLIYLRYN